MLPRLTRVSYPQTRRDDTIETLHGHEIADPYRWLEDPDSAETKAWVDEQRSATEAYLETLPSRDWFSKVMARVASRPRAGIPHEESGWYFLNRNDGSMPQDVWHVARTAEAVAEPGARVLLDPSTWSANGTSSLSTFTVSHDGRYVAVARSDAGSDWQRARARDRDQGHRRAGVVTFAEPTWVPTTFVPVQRSRPSGPVGTQTGALGRLG